MAISLQRLQEESANPEGVAFRQLKRASDSPFRPPHPRLPLSLDAQEQLLLNPFIGPVRCR
jgi:hypothetical protein